MNKKDYENTKDNMDEAVNARNTAKTRTPMTGNGPAAEKFRQRQKQNQ